MWFKNIHFYRLNEQFSIDAQSLEQQLAEHRFRPCSSQESSTFGWVSPMGKDAEQLVFAHERCLLICAQREEKILPAAVINDHLNERIEAIELKEDRKVRRKEKLALKDDITFELLPRAFSRYQTTRAYLDLSKQLLIIDAASAKKAEDLCSLLRETLGSLPIRLPVTQTAPAAVMTQWLQTPDTRPQGLALGQDTELREPQPEGAVLRCRQQDLDTEEISTHLSAGKQAIKLAVDYNNRLTCVLQDDLSIKRLRFTDLVTDKAEEMAEGDAQALFEADFSLMSLELAAFIPALLEAMGGEQTISGQA